MDEAISCSNDLVESSFVVYMVVSISNLYSFEICIIYNILRYGFVLLRHFKNHLSTQNIVSVSSKISLFDPVLFEGTSAMTTPSVYLSDSSFK